MVMLPLLVAIDPGPHTGIAVFDEGKLTEVITLEAERDSMLAYWLKMRKFFATCVAKRSRVILVIEDFRSQAYMTLEGYTTLEVIGFIAGTARLAGAELVRQLPAARRAHIDRAKSVEFSAPPGKHEIDAIAHGLAYIDNHPEEFPR